MTYEPDWIKLSQLSGTFAPASHSHDIANVTGLQGALDGKQVAGSYANASHGHIIADTTGLQAALDGKQAVGNYASALHGHVIDDVAGLQSALDALAGGSALSGLATITVPTGNGRFEHEEQVAATGVTAASRIFLTLAPGEDADENTAEMLDVVSFVGLPGTDIITIRTAFAQPTSGPVKFNWSAA
jgi:hypothetical protein